MAFRSEVWAMQAAQGRRKHLHGVYKEPYVCLRCRKVFKSACSRRDELRQRGVLGAGAEGNSWALRARIQSQRTAKLHCQAVAAINARAHPCPQCGQAMLWVRLTAEVPPRQDARAWRAFARQVARLGPHFKNPG